VLHGHWVEAENQLRVIVGNFFKGLELTLPGLGSRHQVGDLQIEPFPAALGDEVDLTGSEFPNRDDIATPQKILVNQRLQESADRILTVSERGLAEPAQRSRRAVGDKRD
jgi:hypothetical protein